MRATAIGARRSGIIRCVEDHLAGRTFLVGDSYTIADMSVWGWIDRASRVLKGEGDPLARISEHQEVVRRRSRRALP